VDVLRWPGTHERRATGSPTRSTLPRLFEGTRTPDRATDCLPGGRTPGCSCRRRSRAASLVGGVTNRRPTALGHLRSQPVPAECHASQDETSFRSTFVEDVSQSTFHQRPERRPVLRRQPLGLEQYRIGNIYGRLHMGNHIDDVDRRQDRGRRAALDAPSDAATDTDADGVWGSCLALECRRARVARWAGRGRGGRIERAIHHRGTKTRRSTKRGGVGRCWAAGGAVAVGGACERDEPPRHQDAGRRGPALHGRDVAWTGGEHELNTDTRRHRDAQRKGAREEGRRPRRLREARSRDVRPDRRRASETCLRSDLPVCSLCLCGSNLSRDEGRGRVPDPPGRDLSGGSSWCLGGENPRAVASLPGDRGRAA